MLPLAACCRRSAIRLTGTELSSWKQAGSSHPASSAPTVALTTPRLGSGTMHWTCSECGMQHDRNENAALNLLTLAINAARDLPKLAPGPVGPDVTLPDGKALAGGKHLSGETGPDEGRTATSTPASPAVDGGAAPYGGSRAEAVTNTQLQLAIG